MVAGQHTFIDAMIDEIGFVNACNGDRYPEIKEGEEPNPDFVFLSSEPYNFTEDHVEIY